MAIEFHLQKDIGKVIDPDINQCNAYANRCSVALEENNHVSGVELTLTFYDNEEKCVLNWDTPVNRAGYRNSSKNVELGAVALSFLFAQEKFGYDHFMEGIYGEGIDYWVGYSEKHKDYDEYNYLKARLEVSGIGSETPTNTLHSRVKTKINQTKPSDNSGLDAFISVVEFSSPKATFTKKNVS